MKQKLDQIIINSLLQQDEPISSKRLSLLCGVSINTLRRALSTINERLIHQGLRIVSKQSIGCYLVIENEQLASSFLSHFKYDIKRNSYNINYDFYRATYIIRRLLVSKRYISVDDICDELFYSQSTILRDINSAQEYLKRFNLKIKVKRNQGLYIEGDEFQKRICILFAHKMYMRLSLDQKKKEELFADHLLTNQKEHTKVRNDFFKLIKDIPEFEFSFINIPKISNYMILSKTRKEYTKNIVFKDDQIKKIQTTKAYELAKMVYKNLDFFNDLQTTENDYIGLAILIETYKSVTYMNQIRADVLEDTINESVEILQFINNQYELSTNMLDQDFICNFACSIHSISNQVFFNIPYDPEMIYPVQNTCLFSADLCAEFAKYYENKYDIILQQSHTLSLIYIFDRVLADAIVSKKGIKILIMTIYGNAYGYFYANKLFNHIANGIDEVKVKEYQPLTNIDLKHYDLLLTDINYQEQNLTIDIPIINMEFNDRRITYEAINQFIEEKSRKSFDLLSRENIMKTDFNDKESLIEHIANLHKTIKITTSDLKNDILKRDQHINGERKNHLVFVRTYEIDLPGNYIEIFVNKHPIQWNTFKTQIIIFYNYDKKATDDIITINMILRSLVEKSPDELQIAIEHPCKIINLIKK
ncbi:MAG: helix-turn-helix domain-containing protein [Erysipelotrichaceae bacterium]|nr:helix-turn-helix domain-containing protein [Erysipelotrichaceae bacterium]MDD4642112.1 helix-turn-helix domain-containing protein [Erysipelotrichaceae bacterium]